MEIKPIADLQDAFWTEDTDDPDKVESHSFRPTAVSSILRRRRRAFS